MLPPLKEVFVGIFMKTRCLNLTICCLNDFFHSDMVDMTLLEGIGLVGIKSPALWASTSIVTSLLAFEALNVAEVLLDSSVVMMLSIVIPITVSTMMVNFMVTIVAFVTTIVVVLRLLVSRTPTTTIVVSAHLLLWL